MIFKVTGQYGTGRENHLKDYKEEEDARSYIKEELEKAARLKTPAIFRLYDFDDLVAEFDSTKEIISPASQSESGASQGQGRATSFKPTPFNVAPTPRGVPHNWVKDDEDKKK